MEKTATPIYNKSQPTEAKPAEAKAEVEPVEPKPELKDNSVLVPELKRLKDGSYWRWEWVGDMQEDPLYNVVKSGLSILDQTKMEVNLVGDIARYLIEMYGDNATTLYKATRQEMSALPSNFGNPLTSLVRILEIKHKELLNK